MATTQEGKFTIPGGSNAVVVEVSHHSFVSILRNGRHVVTDRGGAADPRFVLSPGDYVVRTDGTLGPVTATRIELAVPSLRDLLQAAAMTGTLQLSAAAPRVHPVDGVAQLPADGKTAATITVRCVDPEGKVVTGASDVLYLRSTGGSLRDHTGATTSRIQLEAGLASFQIVADPAPRFITLTVFGASPALRAELPFEFVPPAPDAASPRGQTSNPADTM